MIRDVVAAGVIVPSIVGPTPCAPPSLSMYLPRLLSANDSPPPNRRPETTRPMPVCVSTLFHVHTTDSDVQQRRFMRLNESFRQFQRLEPCNVEVIPMVHATNSWIGEHNHSDIDPNSKCRLACATH